MIYWKVKNKTYTNFMIDSDILLPEQISIKKESKQAELNVAQSELKKATKERSHHGTWNSGFPLWESQIKEQFWQQEVDRLEKELLEGAY